MFHLVIVEVISLLIIIKSIEIDLFFQDKRGNVINAGKVKIEESVLFLIIGILFDSGKTDAYIYPIGVYMKYITRGVVLAPSGQRAMEALPRWSM
jgi:hypothetical protein